MNERKSAKVERMQHSGSQKYPRQIRRHLWQLSVEQPYYEPTHCYLITGPETVLIDSGHVSGFHQLERQLRQLGLEGDDIDLVVSTHPHPDHIGGSTCLAREKTIVHAAHGDLINQNTFGRTYAQRVISMIDTIYNEVEAFQTRFHRTSVESYKHSSLHFATDPVFTRPLRHGDRLTCASFNFTVLETPGHNPWHIALMDEKEGILISGDTILRGGTTIIAQLGDNHNEYLETLTLLESTNVTVVLPGHGREFDSSGQAVSHARRFFFFILNSLRRHLKVPATTWELTQKIFHSWLDTFEIALICYARIASYLDWLVRQGDVIELNSNVDYHRNESTFVLRTMS